MKKYSASRAALIAAALAVSLSATFARSDPATLHGLWETEGGSLVRIERDGERHVGRLMQPSAEAEAAGYVAGEIIFAPVGPHEDDGRFLMVVATRPQAALAAGLTLREAVTFTAELFDGGARLVAEGEAGAFRVVSQGGRPAKESYVPGAGLPPILALRRVPDDTLVPPDFVPPKSWPRIQGIVAVNQALLADPVVGNPGVLDDPLELHDRDVTLLLVYGQSLIRQGVPVATETGVTYQTLIESENGVLPSEATRAPAHAARMASAWRAAWDEAGRRAGAPLRRADFQSLLVKVRIGRGVAPGLKDICVGPAVDAWPLPSGTVRARAEFIRRVTIGENHAMQQFPEPAGTIYLHPRVADPVSLQVTLLDDPGPAVQELTAVISLDDGRGQGGGTSRSWSIPLRRESDTQPVFQGPPIQVSSAAFDPTRPGSGARTGESLVGVVGADGSLISEAALAQAAIAGPPARTAADTDPAAGFEGPAAGWADALWEAAAVVQARPPNRAAMTLDDWDRLARQNAWERRGLIMPSGVTVKLGHHAAMLLLRATFIKALEMEVQRLDAAAAGEQTLQHLVDFLRPIMQQPDHPLARVIVETEYGSATQPPRYYPLARFFDPAFLALRAARAEPPAVDPNAGAGGAARYRFELAQAGNRLLRARVRTAIGIYRENIIGAIQVARASATAEDLLRLTGRGFEPVHNLVRPHLLVLRRVAQGEVSTRGDPEARRYLQELSRLAQRLEFEDQRTRDFVSFSTMFISLAALPVALAGGTGVMLIDGGLLAFNAVDLAYGVYDALATNARENRALRIARGAASVLGNNYLSRIDLQATPGWANAVMIVTSALGIHGLRGDLFEFLGRVPLSQARRRAPDLLEGFRDRGVDSLRRWPDADQKLFLAAVSDALARQARGQLGGLDNALALLRAADDIKGAAARLRMRQEARLYQACVGTNLCFPAGTPVLTAEGPQAIETLVPGSLVWARDARTGGAALRRIQRVLTSQPEAFCVIDYVPMGPAGPAPAARIIASVEHPFRPDASDAFVPARNLMPGQRLVMADGLAVIQDVQRVTAAELGSPVGYNLEVAEFSTYFAGEGGLWVHNEGLTCEQGVALLSSLLAKGQTLEVATKVLRSRGLAAAAEVRLNEILRQLDDFKQAQKAIDEERLRIRADPFLGNAHDGGTVARVNISPRGNRPIFGYNSTLVGQASEYATAQRYLGEMQRRLGVLQGLDLNHHDLQWLKHAEAQALMKAHDAVGGRWGRRVEMHVDRTTCALSCQRAHTGLIHLVDLMGFEEVVIISRNGTRTSFRPGRNPPVENLGPEHGLFRFVTGP